MRREKEISLNSFIIKDEFWSYFQKLTREKVIPYQKAVLEDRVLGLEMSHAIENFRIAAGEKQGEFYGMVFQDSDVYKWLETAAYSLQSFPDAALEKEVDDVVTLIGNAQQEDGYLDTYYIIKDQTRRWQNLHENHELYCAGHLIEAGVAYYEASGKRQLLNIAVHLADHIGRRFGKGKIRGIPGHEEIELALIRLYGVTGEKKYLELAMYFIDERGTQPDYFAEETRSRGWSRREDENTDDPYNNQNHLPVREQSEAVGHSVRAMYLYTAMAAAVLETGDEKLWQAVRRLWDNTVNKKMYLTGGLGSTVHGEAFTANYNLPNDLIYAETCASVGLVFFARRMLENDVRNEYGDIMERALYNGVLSGMQHDGTKFFYVNPLEVVPGISGELKEYAHVRPERVSWYPCACCPPNLARLIMSLAGYSWGEVPEKRIIYSHLYIGGVLKCEAEKGIEIRIKTDYPWSGVVEYEFSGDMQREEALTLAVRIPGWCKKHRILVNGEETRGEVRDGYCSISRMWKNNDRVILDLDMPARFVYANEHVRQDIGTTALMRGPLCYCLEEKDNGAELFRLFINCGYGGKVEIENDEQLGKYCKIELSGERLETEEEPLYSEKTPEYKQVKVTAVPYYLWGNRGKGEMRVWNHWKL